MENAQQVASVKTLDCERRERGESLGYQNHHSAYPSSSNMFSIKTERLIFLAPMPGFVAIANPLPLDGLIFLLLLLIRYCIFPQLWLGSMNNTRSWIVPDIGSENAVIVGEPTA